jgi:tRNA threonylcarbamoyl adenosine modification protein (Sua5/YciO/YrdC/YwlC family)
VIEYIVPNNIDERIIKRAAKMLEDGALAALPTDTSWSIVCSLKSPGGIKKLRKLSGERDERHFTLLCSSISQFAQACDLDNTRFRLIKRLSPGPYVYILNALPGIGKILDIPRREVGVRIPDNPIPIKLIETLQHPLYSITAKKSMCKEEWETFDEEDSETELPPIPENELFENGWELQEIGELDLILDSGEERERIFSTIIDMCTDEIKLLRKGAGEWPV